GQPAPGLPVALAVLHFGLLALALFALSGGAALGFFGWLFAFLAFALWFGQTATAAAHDLIHRRDPRLRNLGTWVYVSLLFGHHTSAHRHVHHRFVATPDDPSTADIGESFYDFAPRSWIGGFVAGYEIERTIMKPRFGSPGRSLHPYAVYLGGALGFVVAITLIFGPLALIAYLALCTLVQLQVMMADYVQHYGLERRRIDRDRREPVGMRHSWNAPHLFSGLALLNGPRDGDHHMHPGRDFAQLTIDAGAPTLPHSLPVMSLLALVPPVFRSLMDPRVKCAAIGSTTAINPGANPPFRHRVAGAGGELLPFSPRK